MSGPLISNNIRGGQAKLERDLKEVAFFISLDKDTEIERDTFRQVLAGYMEGTGLAEELVQAVSKRSRREKPQEAELPCLALLCDYDTNNGTTYGLFWGCLLSRMVSQIAGNNLAKKMNCWLILNEIGTVMLLRRQPKHFSSGLQLASLEIVLLIGRAVAMISAALAIALTLCEATGAAPDYISACERLKDISLERLRVLSGRDSTARSRGVYGDILEWRYNSSFRGRSGCMESARDSELRKTIASLSDKDVIALLSIFDEVCKTAWAGFAKDYFCRLGVFAQKCR